MATIVFGHLTATRLSVGIKNSRTNILGLILPVPKCTLMGRSTVDPTYVKSLLGIDDATEVLQQLDLVCRTQITRPGMSHCKLKRETACCHCIRIRSS